jgi:hypothetical protein
LHARTRYDEGFSTEPDDEPVFVMLNVARIYAQKEADGWKLQGNELMHKNNFTEAIACYR